MATKSTKSSFTQTKLVGGRVLVEGTDVRGTSGSEVLDGSEWESVQDRLMLRDGEAEFAEAVEAMFKPLTDAAERIGKRFEKPTDTVDIVVFEEGNDGGERPVAREAVRLGRDATILKVLAAGGKDQDRLVWVGDVLDILG